MSPSQQQTIQGNAPAYQTVSDFQYDEIIIAAPALKENAIDLSLSAALPSLKIYCWLFGEPNAANNNYVNAELAFYNQLTKIAKLPIAVAAISLATDLTKNLPTVCVSGGTAGQDTLGLYVANPTGTQPLTLLLQPLYLRGIVDRATLSIKDFRGVSLIRAFLAIVSSQ